MTKKSLGALALSTLFACSAWAETGTWQYDAKGNPWTSGDGYSIDSNGVYTDSKGFMLFEGLTLNKVDYSNKEFDTDASTSSKGQSPVKYSDPLQTGFATLYFGSSSTITNSDFSGGAYTVKSIYDNPSALMVCHGTTLEKVNFSGSTFGNQSGDTNSAALNISGSLNSIDFSNTKISGATAVLSSFGEFNNINFSNAEITGIYNGLKLGFAEVQNLCIENAKISAWEYGLNAWTNIDGLNAQNATFAIPQEYQELGAAAVKVNTGNAITNADFRGATVNETSFSKSDISNSGTVKNAMLGEGEIYSAIYDWYYETTSNDLGLMLDEGETFTITAHETAAKLTVDSLVNGTIEIEVGADGNGKLLIAAGTQLTLSENAQIVVKIDESIPSQVADDGLDLNTILVFEEGASLVIQGAEGMTAQAALLSKISAQSTSGDALGNVTFSGTESVVQNVVVPEPSAFGLLAGIGALALVASRRRRK